MLTIFGVVAEFLVVVAVALAAVLLRVIDSRGFTSSVAVGIAIVYGGGLPWFVLVAVFFILGVVFTLYRYGYKRKLGAAQEKGGARNWPNILANGGAAAVISVLNFFNPNPTLTALFLGAVSTSAADTAATELGLLSKSQPKMITDLSEVVTPGTSGGVTSLGVMGAVFASATIGLMGFLLGLVSGLFEVLLVCVVGGVLGAFVDSVLGATVQRRGYCIICLRPTESLRHCGEPSKRTGGAPFIENNVVNMIATLAGAVASLAVFGALGLSA